MVNLDVLMIVLIVGLIVMAFRHQIWEFAWKVFYANLSDEKLEKLVRQEYESYELSRVAAANGSTSAICLEEQI